MAMILKLFWLSEAHWLRQHHPIEFSMMEMLLLGFPCGSAGKNPRTMWKIWVRSLDWEDPLEMGKATHSSILAKRIP